MRARIISPLLWLRHAGRMADRLFGPLFRDPVMAHDAAIDLAALKARHHRILATLGIEAVVMACLLAALLVVASQPQVKYLYYTTDRTEQTQPRTLQSIKTPILDQPAVVAWVTATLTDTFTFDFSNYNTRISSHEQDFLDESWKEFVLTLFNSGFLNEINRQQILVSAAPTRGGVITAHGPKDDTYEWTVEVPMVITFSTNDNRKEYQRHMFEAVVRRVPIAKNPTGLAIARIRTQNDSGKE